MQRRIHDISDLDAFDRYFINMKSVFGLFSFPDFGSIIMQEEMNESMVHKTFPVCAKCSLYTSVRPSPLRTQHFCATFS